MLEGIYGEKWGGYKKADTEEHLPVVYCSLFLGLVTSYVPYWRV